MFEDVFEGCGREQAHRVYNYIKINRLIVFFCSEEHIRTFFQRKKRGCSSTEEAIERIILDLKQLEEEGTEIFKKKLKVIMDNQVNLLKKVST